MQAPLLPLISDYVAHHAQERAQQLFLWHEGKTYTYEEAVVAIDNCAKALLARGVQKGDRVGFYGNPTPFFWIHFLATTSIGAIWMGLNPKYKREELGYVISDAEPSLIFAQTEAGGTDRSDELAALAKSVDANFVPLGGATDFVQRFEALCAEGETVANGDLLSRRTDVDTHDPAFLVYTSGSTGRPKGALLSHYGENFCNIISVDRKGLDNRTCICNLPINHVGAIGDICARMMVGGGTLYFQEAFDPAAMMRLIEQKKLNTWGAVPAVFQLCANSPVFDEVDLTSIDLIAWGGARMPRELLATLMEKTGCTRCTTGYGMTETVGGVCYSRLEDDIDILAETIGTPDPRQPLRLWHADDRPALPGEEGEIQVQGDFVMKAYWRRPDATAETFTADGWMKTGDVAIVRPDGNLELVGRLSEMFKSGGYNVYPREVELAIEEIDGIVLAAVVAMEDPTFQEVGHAYVMTEPEAPQTEETIIAFLRDRIANYKVPKQVTILAELPMLPIGKVDKKKLKEMAAG